MAAADSAFQAKRYDEAGRLYASLDRQGLLPATRRDHWAYCRWKYVVSKINAKPKTAEEWAEIDAEILRIKALSPNNWYGEYLRNRASKRTTNRRLGRSNRLVVRGSAPEEPTPKVGPSRVQVRPNSSTSPEPAERPLPTPKAVPAAPPRTGDDVALALGSPIPADAPRAPQGLPANVPQLAGPRDAELPHPPRRSATRRESRRGRRGYA